MCNNIPSYVPVRWTNELKNEKFEGYFRGEFKFKSFSGKLPAELNIYVQPPRKRKLSRCFRWINPYSPTLRFQSGEVGVGPSLELKLKRNYVIDTDHNRFTSLEKAYESWIKSPCPLRNSSDDIKQEWLCRNLYWNHSFKI